MNAIALAYDGQWEFMLDVLETGGFIQREKQVPSEPKEAPKGKGKGTQTLTPALFKALFAKPSSER